MSPRPFQYLRTILAAGAAPEAVLHEIVVPSGCVIVVVVDIAMSVWAGVRGRVH